MLKESVIPESLESKSTLGDLAKKNDLLSDKELNSPINGIDTEEGKLPEMASLDCRSECKYNTGKTWKSSNYGYSD